MNGQDLLNQLTPLLGGETIDQTTGLILINMARLILQEDRPWQALKKTDNSVTIPAGYNPNTPHNIPTDFARFIDDRHEIILSDGNDIVYVLKECPIEDKLLYQKQFGWFVMDESLGVFYVLGTVPQTLPAYFNYLFDPGDIALNTKWGAFPPRYAKIFPFMAAAMFRLGVDYDSLNARNAADNEMRGNMLFKSMREWDTNLALASSQQTDPAGKYHNRGTFGNRSYYTNYPQ